jgi:hypothetical protein
MPTTPPRRPTSAPPNPVTRPIAADAMTATEPESGAKVLPPDSRVGKYVVRKPLGKGGMGCVSADRNSLLACFRFIPDSVRISCGRGRCGRTVDAAIAPFF